jgi:hypothetical protein
MPMFTKKGKKEEPVPATPPAGFGHRTPEQMQEALGAARLARKERSELITGVRSGKVTLEAILTGDYADNRTAQNLPVRYLLKNLRGVGPARANKIVDKMEIREGRRVRGLGRLQRAELIDWYNANKPAEGEE